MKRIIDFYVGVNSENRSYLEGLIHEINEAGQFFIKIRNHFDDHNGYYTYSLTGNMESYSLFLHDPLIKSVSHFEED